MAVVLTVTPTPLKQGDILVISATGITVSGNAKVTVAAEVGGGMNRVSGTFAADGSGNLALAGKMDVEVGEGPIDVTLHDVTANSDTTARVLVQSE